MLSGEGNAGERWKTTIGLISKKKQLCTCSRLFLYISLPLFCTTTTWNFQKLLTCTFYGGNVVRVLVHFFFFNCRSFSLWWPLAFSHFVTASTKFSSCSSNKKMSPLFSLSRSRSLSPFFSWSFAGLPPTFSFSLYFSCSIFKICGHDNESKLKTLDNTDTETISALNFRLHWLSLLYKTLVAMRFPAKVTSSCIWVAIPVDWFILH